MMGMSVIESSVFSANNNYKQNSIMQYEEMLLFFIQIITPIIFQAQCISQLKIHTLWMELTIPRPNVI